MQSPVSTQLTQARLPRRVLTLQAILAAVASVAASPFGLMPALSVLIGGGACVLANAVAVLWVFRDYRAQAPEAILRRLFSAEVVKIALVLALFGLAFAAVEGLNVPLLLGSYIVIQVLPPIFAANRSIPK